MFIPGLIGFWRLNKGSGLIALDSSVYGNDGSLEGNNPTWVDGISGKAVNFPGVNERIDCGNDSPLDQIGNGSFWLSFWMKSKDTVPNNYGMLCTTHVSGVDRFWFGAYSTQNRLNFLFEKNNHSTVLHSRNQPAHQHHHS